MVKRLKKEFIAESVEENVQEESSAQKLEELVCEEKINIYEGNWIEVYENVEEVQAAVLKQEEERKSIEHDQDFTHIQENIANVFVPANFQAENIQISSKKIKGKSVVELKNEGIQISSINFRGKSYAMIGESNWRPKTRAKNKLRLNMKRILNPRLMKDKITIIEDSSSRENLEEDEDLNSQQVDSKKEDSLTVKSSSIKNRVIEQSKYSSIKGDRSQKVPVAVADQHEEDDDAIFKKLNIP